MTQLAKLLVLGNGGREHAIAWKLSLSPLVATVYVAPGNYGTSKEKKIINLALTDFDALAQFVKNNNIEYTVVGPEQILAQGIVDFFQAHGLKIWGTTKFCAQLESSKVFAKNFMHQNAIATAAYIIFDNLTLALEYLNTRIAPIVIKADGLAGGKGVVVATTIAEAKDFVNYLFSAKQFVENPKIIIEEYLAGTEASVMLMLDGKNTLILPAAQDHKRLSNNNLGPNTGGMGAFSPLAIITPQLEQQIINKIINPLLKGMQQLNVVYTGFLYLGLMVDSMQNFKVLEFNCRLGDPEAQAILMRLDSDFYQLIKLALNQNLHQTQAIWKNKACVDVVLATKNYPYTSSKNDTINGLDQIIESNELKVFYGACLADNNKIITAGGRVLSVAALADNLVEAQHKAYQTIAKINFSGMQYRTDIAQINTGNNII